MASPSASASLKPRAKLGCDEDEGALKQRMKRLAETKPTPLKSLVKKPRKKPG